MKQRPAAFGALNAAKVVCNLRFEFGGNTIEGERLQFDVANFTGSVERPRAHLPA